MPREVGDAPALGTLEVGLDGARSSPLEAKTSLLLAGACRSLPTPTIPAFYELGGFKALWFS